MHKSAAFIISGLTILAQTGVAQINAQEHSYSHYATQDEYDAASSHQFAAEIVSPFTPFTGKITKNKVRLRLLPNLDSAIIKELAQNDMLIVVGETDDFYAVQAPAGLKSYVFRTYVLDNVIEANRVNVRLQPDTEAPIIVQLQSGDRIEGQVSPLNNKWLEITPPSITRFYVSKDYIEKLGDASMLATIEKKREEVNILLNSAYLASQAEMQKSFPEINMDTVYANLNKIVNEYKGFQEQTARAKELISSIQDNYLQKKISYLEAKTKIVQDDWQQKNQQLTDQMKSQQQKMSCLEQQLKKTNGAAPFIAQNNGISNKMAAWVPVEKSLYETWAQNHDNRSQEEYYLEQSNSSVALRGIIEPYNRVIKNKPGDYILVNQSNHLPIAYLYSTQVNLQDRVGHTVTIYGSPRENNSFAFPAYFVLGIE
jgi:hypothetical protein